ncbi:MAG: polysaccharide biosynthesis tyrosine autokinase [Armatimonadetes bacterium]|nr:polysaccharide biosynthesis tyrosine autokinase [Armatimonadota bacterium]MDW8153876.1 polysaccharide biosynthesis tyrosine autokinase [Armatimonadota bacterium]
MEFWTYYRILRRRRWLLVGLTLSVALVAVLLERPRAGEFEATATLTTAPPEDQRVSDFVAGTRRDRSAEQQRALAVDLLRSLTVAERVIRSLGLSLTPVQLVGRIRVQRDPGSDLIRVTATGSTEQEAVRLANAVAEVASAFHREINRRGVTLAREFVEKLVADMGAGLRQAEEELWRFRNLRQLYTRAPSRINAMGTVEGEITRIDLALRELETELAMVRERIQQHLASRPQSPPQAPAVPFRATGTVMLDGSRLAILQSAERTYFARVGDVIEGFRVTAVEEDAVEVRQGALQHRFAIDPAAPLPQVSPGPQAAPQTPQPQGPAQDPEYARLLQSHMSLEARRLVLLARKEALRQLSRAIRQELPTLSRYELEEARLERNVQILQQQYTSLQQRLMDIRVREQEFQTIGTLTVVDLARMARRTSPLSNRPMRGIAGALLGLVGGVGLVLFAEYTDNRLKTPEQAERLLGVPALGAIPRHNPPFDEGYRMLRASLFSSNGAGPPKILAVTSTKPREGTSTVVLNLARACADMGDRTVVVDAQLRRPALHRLLRAQNGWGLAEVLSGSACVEEVLVQLEPNLWLLPAGSGVPDPGKLLNPRQVEPLLRQLGGRADVVLVDVASAGAFADAYVLGPLCDGVLLVVEAGRPPRGIEELVRVQLQRAGAKVVGVVVNKASPEHVDTYFYHHQFFQVPRNGRFLRKA